MTAQEYIDKKMEQYSEAFDFYMDVGTMPDNISPSDILGGYMQSVFDSNPQLTSQNPLWKELMKENLMRFLQTMLALFIPVEQDYRKQNMRITAFYRADAAGKQEMWQGVCTQIAECYSPHEVNLQGYIKQLEESRQSHEKESVFNSLTKDWHKANKERKERQEKEILEKHKKRWEIAVKDYGMTDYKRLKKVDDVYYHYPALQEIVRLIGREQPQDKEEKDEIKLKYQPILLSAHVSYEEIDRIAVGRDLSHMMPSEAALLADQATDILFYQKYATDQLQLFANRPPMKAQKKEEHHRTEKPRLLMGPIIVGVDTSGSMSGKPEELARTLLLQLLRIAKRKKRKCFLITFSVRAKAIDLAHPSNWNKLHEFLMHGFSGGTDGEEMLGISLDTLQREEYAFADILIISDFYFPAPVKPTLDKMRIEHEKGTRFYGLQIGKHDCWYKEVLDKVWKV